MLEYLSYHLVCRKNIMITYITGLGPGQIQALLGHGKMEDADQLQRGPFRFLIQGC
jgi:hypothetical protein